MGDVLVRVDPRFAPEHAAFYLHGLFRHTGSRELPLTRDGFPQSYTDQQPLAFVLRRDGHERRIYLSAGDKPELDSAALEWADLYAKVNLAPELVPAAYAHKVRAIGPSHALRIWTLPTTMQVAWRTYRLGGQITATKDHFRGFWIMYSRRVGEDLYEPEVIEDRYVFYNSWLWKKHGDVNPPRAAYVSACQELAAAGVIKFEGGFTARRRNDMPEYDGYVASRKYSLAEYLERIKRSNVVFNNPAVHRCHGWKLPEFLRLGKAIITLPLARELPAPLRHGEHVHVVDGTQEALKDAIRTIVEDADYRRQLEEAARAYWTDYLAPETVISRVAEAAFGATRPAGLPGNR